VEAVEVVSIVGVVVVVKMAAPRKGAGERRQDERQKRRDKHEWRGSSWKLRSGGNGKRLHDWWRNGDVYGMRRWRPRERVSERQLRRENGSFVESVKLRGGDRRN
jgi:hypothetical protein